MADGGDDGVLEAMGVQLSSEGWIRHVSHITPQECGRQKEETIPSDHRLGTIVLNVRSPYFWTIILIYL